jgi:hypothetical protein
VNNATARAAGAQFEMLFLDELLKPLSAAFGDFGDVALGGVTRTIAERDSSGFGCVVARFLENSHG